LFKIIAILYVGAYIIWEAPARNILLVGKKACAEQYRKIIAGLGEIISMEFLNRYAVEDRVFDDRIFESVHIKIDRNIF
jgi:hypothetical protein